MLLRIGEYRAGSDPLADEAIAKRPRIDGFLRQEPERAVDWATMRAELTQVLA